MAFTFTDDSATISTTEYSLPRDANYAAGTPVAVACAVKFALDFSALQVGDEMRLRVYRHINGTQRVVFETLITGTGAAQAYELDEFWGSASGWDVTLVKTAGTDRAVGWSDGRFAPPTASDVVTAVMAFVVENAGGVTLRRNLARLFAVSHGKADEMDDGATVFYGAGNATQARVSASQDGNTRPEPTYDNTGI